MMRGQKPNKLMAAAPQQHVSSGRVDRYRTSTIRATVVFRARDPGATVALSHH